QKAARKTPGIDATLDGQRELGHALYLINGDLLRQTFDKTLRIPSRQFQVVAVIKIDINPSRITMPDQSGLATLARPQQAYHRGIHQSISQLGREMPRDKPWLGDGGTHNAAYGTKKVASDCIP